MKKIFAAIGLMAMMGSASAADLPMATKAPVQYPTVANWSGFYLGLHGGYGWSDFSPDVNLSPFFSDPAGSGWVFGGQVGYNWQPYQSLVVGIEVDYSAADIKDSQTFAIPNTRTSLGLDTKVDSLGSARGRVGYLIVPNVLAYGTAGLGWAHAEATVTATNGVQTLSSSANANQFGWVAGLGLEWAIVPQLIIGLEYLHYDFGTVGYSFQPIGTINSSLTDDVLRARFNYKF